MRYISRTESRTSSWGPPRPNAQFGDDEDVPRALQRRGDPLRFSDSVVIVPGLRNSGPAHWQTHWHAALPGARRVVQRDWDTPDLDAWGAAVARTLASIVRPIVVAHSYGCFAALAASTAGAHIAAALLVAPADVGLLAVDARVPRRRLPFPSTLVASTNDPWMKLTHAGELASVWGSRFVPYRDAGHINAESGYGPWLEGTALLEELAFVVQRGVASSVATQTFSN
jgi:predicted alpha/beta hydrolase family esterase